MRCTAILIATASVLLAVSPVSAQQPRAGIEYIGKPVRGIPVSLAVRAGDRLYVSGTPAFDKAGKLAVGDFPAQMKQVMENITSTLTSTGSGWNRVVRTTVYLTRREDFEAMNRVYSTYFDAGKYPARTTVVVSALPHPDFLVEVECEALIQ